MSSVPILLVISLFTIVTVHLSPLLASISASSLLLREPTRSPTCSVSPSLFPASCATGPPHWPVPPIRRPCRVCCSGLQSYIELPDKQSFPHCLGCHLSWGKTLLFSYAAPVACLGLSVVQAIHRKERRAGGLEDIVDSPVTFNGSAIRNGLCKIHSPAL